jgi:uncharacterized cupredoxin-like copper-binding protein
MRSLVLAGPLLVLVVVACGGTAASPSAAVTASPPAATSTPIAATSTPIAGTTVNITLEEWAIGADAASVPAGQTVFHVTNQGPEDEHEFVVIKTDLGMLELPTDENGAVDEEGLEVSGEIEDLVVGSSEDLTLLLDPGQYVLICNIWSEEEQESHYQLGMRTELTVQ